MRSKGLKRARWNSSSTPAVKSPVARPLTDQRHFTGLIGFIGEWLNITERNRYSVSHHLSLIHDEQVLTIPLIVLCCHPYCLVKGAYVP